MSDQVQANATDDEYPDEKYAWYVMVVLVIAYAFSYIDRTILTLLVEPIRASLDISDTEISLLHGFAFALFYTILGMPIGWLADRGNRIKIISVAVYMWSFATAACGLANSFLQMFLARVSVGIGEAALSPSAYSLVTDYFPPEKLSRAFSFYNAGLFIGSGLALVIGGAVIEITPALDLPVIGHLEPWQVTFMYVGLPGLLIGLWVMTLREPKRLGKTADEDGTASLGSHIRRAFRYITTRPGAYFYHFFGFSLYAFIWTGTAAWTPTFFMRTFEMTAGEVGSIYGFIVVIFGLLGVTSGGMLAGYWRKQGKVDAEIRTGITGVLLTLPFGIIAPLLPTSTLAFIGFAGLTFFASFPWGAATASLQLITPNRLRAMVSAMFLFLVNLAGIGLAPTVIALITDLGFGYDGAVKYSIAIAVAVAAPISAFLLYRCLAPYRAEFNAMHPSAGS
ncbi:MAG: MFS transporter [Rhodospirillaceae bacterium]|jgi:MFS family permease|nr:MFS transporter [Rhodospirillaceae bacterium]MBT5241195.1 MFS transporter [Rhodospirillaceae bacterium]MBT5565170.1 MFS transporter [Rhodospirillaceae bacterium]MBT6088192.1 MFS transporter [Rhodospirillaceae bacterium]MBT7449483.1 MFS transporter [Rhodospirillaceae bacterium]